ARNEQIHVLGSPRFCVDAHSVAAEERIPNPEVGELHQQIAEVGVKVHGVLEGRDYLPPAPIPRRVAPRAKPSPTDADQSAPARRGKPSSPPTMSRGAAAPALRMSTSSEA